MIFFPIFKNKKGFTFLELLIVIAIISSLSILAFPLYSNYLSDSFSNTFLLELEAGFKKTRQKSFSSMNNSSYGIYFDKALGNFVFYQGDSYVERIDEFSVKISSSLEVIEPKESVDIILAKGDGAPEKEQVFIFYSKDSLEKKITINKYGAIFFD